MAHCVICFSTGKWTYSEAEGADYLVANQISNQDVKRAGNVPESSSVGFSCDCIGEKMARDSPVNHKPKLLLVILLYLQMGLICWRVHIRRSVHPDLDPASLIICVRVW